MPRPSTRHRLAGVVATLGLTLVLGCLAAPAGAGSPSSASTTVDATMALRSLTMPLSANPPAAAGKKVVYQQPTTYSGLKKKPKVKPQPISTTVLSETGTDPDVYVDEAGTGHIIWNEGRGDDSDAAYYCRLKRAATSCDATAVLTWEKSYGAGDGPQYNIDNDGPRIVRVGDQLLVLSHRYPTGSDKPDGASSHTTLAWVSNDGGTTWSGGVIVGKRSLGQVAVVNSGNSPAVANVAYDPFCGGMCLTSYRSGSYQGAEGVINADPNSNYYGTIANTSSGLLVGMADAGGQMWLKQWNGAEPITDPANWAATSPALAGAEPDLATGPSGTFLLSRVGLTGGRRVSRVGPGLTLANPVTVTANGGYEGVLDEDPGGGLRVAWTDSGTGGGLHVRTAVSPAAGFGSTQTVLKGDRTGQPELSATSDGGGFVVANATGWLNDPGRITAIGVGSVAPTGNPGLGNIPGGGNVTCTAVKFGSFDVKTVSGCFLKGIGDYKGMVVTEAPITLNGLVIEPMAGAQVVLDPAKLRIDTIGQARVLLRNGSAEIELFRGVIHRDLNGLKAGDTLFEFPQDLFQASVLGFPVASGIPIELTAQGVRIPVEIRLPAAFGGFTGKATLLGTEADGLRLESLHVSIGPIPLGVAILDKVALDWQQGGTWTGSGKITVPAGGSITAQISFVAGEFASASFSYQPQPPITIGPFVYLTSVGGGFALKPDLQIAATAQVGAGAAVQGAQPITADGKFTMTFPSSGPAKFQLDASIDLLALTIGQGELKFDTSGYAAFKGGSHVTLGPLAGDVNVNGFVDATGGQFGAQATGSLKMCVTIDVGPEDIDLCAGVGTDFALSSIGFAACASFDAPAPIDDFSAGLEQRWDELDPAVIASPIILTKEILTAITFSCSTSGYAIPPPSKTRAARAIRAAGGAAFALAGGLPTATFLVPGVGGTPDITVTGPDGTVLYADGVTSPAVKVFTIAGSDARWVLVEKPKAGSYAIAPTATSVPLGTVMVSRGYDPATIKGKVKSKGKGKHKSWVVAYSTKHLANGQGITFRERGKFGTNLLGNVSKKKGTFRIKPASGPGGKRVVEALITHDGVVKRVVRVGTYLAPPPAKAGKATHLVVKKKGSKVTLRFKPGKHAARTEVLVKGNAGSKIARVLTGRKHKVSLTGFTWDTKLTVTVTTYGPDGKKGKVTKKQVRVRGPR